MELQKLYLHFPEINSLLFRYLTTVRLRVILEVKTSARVGCAGGKVMSKRGRFPRVRYASVLGDIFPTSRGEYEFSSVFLKERAAFVVDLSQRKILAPFSIKDGKVVYRFSSHVLIIETEMYKGRYLARVIYVKSYCCGGIDVFKSITFNCKYIYSLAPSLSYFFVLRKKLFDVPVDKVAGLEQLIKMFTDTDF
jgi:hypothetical protein